MFQLEKQERVNKQNLLKLPSDETNIEKSIMVNLYVNYPWFLYGGKYQVLIPYLWKGCIFTVI